MILIFSTTIFVSCVPSTNTVTPSDEFMSSQEYNKKFSTTPAFVLGRDASNVASTLGTIQVRELQNGEMVTKKGWLDGPSPHFHADGTSHGLKHKTFYPDGSLLNSTGTFGGYSTGNAFRLPSGQYRIEYEVHGIKVFDIIDFDGQSFLGFVDDVKIEGSQLSWSPPPEGAFAYSIHLREKINGPAQAYFVMSPSFDLKEALNNSSFDVQFKSGDTFHLTVEAMQYFLHEVGSTQNNISRKHFYSLTMP